MPDPYATIAQADSAVQTVIADAMETRSGEAAQVQDAEWIASGTRSSTRTPSAWLGPRLPCDAAISPR